MSETAQQKPAEIEAIGYLTGAVRGYERAGGSSPVIVVPVGYVRTLLAVLAAQEAARRDSDDSARLVQAERDACAAVLFTAAAMGDFPAEGEGMQEYLIRLGARIQHRTAPTEDTINAERQGTHHRHARDDGRNRTGVQ